MLHMQQTYRGAVTIERMAKNREELLMVTTDRDYCDVSISTSVSNIDRQTYTVTELSPDSVWR